MTELSENKMVLSIFPGIGLLDMAFEEKGFCVVRGPDTLWGGDIRNFHPPLDIFWGMIGGPPCQDFSGKRRSKPTGYGKSMLKQYVRTVTEAQPEWWLMENVSRVPDIDVAGYVTQRFDINQAWYCDVSRLRHIQFGSKSGRLLHIERRQVTAQSVTYRGAALANDSRPFAELCNLQGLPKGFDLPPFLAKEKKKAVGNGVPLQMGRVLAQAVIDAYCDQSVTVQLNIDGLPIPSNLCACGCGRKVTGRKTYYDYSCRKRAQRKRDKYKNVTVQAGHGKGATNNEPSM